MIKKFIIGNDVEAEAFYAEDNGLVFSEEECFWYCFGSEENLEEYKQLNEKYSPEVEIEVIDIRTFV